MKKENTLALKCPGILTSTVKRRILCLYEPSCKSAFHLELFTVIDLTQPGFESKDARLNRPEGCHTKWKKGPQRDGYRSLNSILLLLSWHISIWLISVPPP